MAYHGIEADNGEWQKTQDDGVWRRKKGHKFGLQNPEWGRGEKDGEKRAKPLLAVGKKLTFRRKMRENGAFRMESKGFLRKYIKIVPKNEA